MGSTRTNFFTKMSLIISPGIRRTLRHWILDADLSHLVSPRICRTNSHTPPISILLCKIPIRTCLHTHISNSITKCTFSTGTCADTRFGRVLPEPVKTCTVDNTLTSFQNRIISIVRIWTCNNTSLGNIDISKGHSWGLGTVLDTNPCVVLRIPVCRTISWLDACVGYVLCEMTDGVSRTS